MGDYRGVTLMSSLYKIYTMILAERLREEVERKKILSQTTLKRVWEHWIIYIF